MQLSDLVQRELIFPSLEATDAKSVLKSFAQRFVAGGFVRDADELYGRLLEREELGSTGIGSGVAIPHCKLPGLKRVLLAVGTVAGGIDFSSVDHQPVRLFFVLASPESNPAEHLKSLAAISKWIKAGSHIEEVLETDQAEVIYGRLTGDSVAMSSGQGTAPERG